MNFNEIIINQLKIKQYTYKITRISIDNCLRVAHMTSIMDKALNFSEDINSKINKANRNLGLIFRTFTYMDKKMFLNLYKSIVHPHVEYAVTVCTLLYKKDMVAIENLQRRAKKISPNDKSPNIPRNA